MISRCLFRKRRDARMPRLFQETLRLGCANEKATHAEEGREIDWRL
jgi:hypothetical protein